MRRALGFARGGHALGVRLAAAEMGFARGEQEDSLSLPGPRAGLGELDVPAVQPLKEAVSS